MPAKEASDLRLNGFRKIGNLNVSEYVSVFEKLSMARSYGKTLQRFKKIEGRKTKEGVRCSYRGADGSMLRVFEKNDGSLISTLTAQFSTDHDDGEVWIYSSSLNIDIEGRLDNIVEVKSFFSYEYSCGFIECTYEDKYTTPIAVFEKVSLLLE